MGDWRLGSYELRRRLGEGGMAQVYLARDVRLGRDVAVKVLDPKLAERPGFRERFMREARVAAALDHPNIVPLYDFGDTDALFLVMPYVSGGSLQDMLPKAPLPIGEVVTYGSQIADALEYAHQRKVVHRDVKPANMLVHADGRLMLSDFGLAKIVSQTHQLAAPRNRPDAGTPEYMAPEQVVGTSDARSDIYGLGVVLYLLLTGRLPFSGSSSHDVMQAHLYKDPAPVRRYNPNAPAAIEAVVMRAMAKQPAERFQRASELGAALLSALIADDHDSPPFILGSSSHGSSRPTGQMPVVAPPASDLSGEPPWLRTRAGSAPIPQATPATQTMGDSGQTSSAARTGSGPALSDWDPRRSHNSTNDQLPRLNTPFTNLDPARQAPNAPYRPDGDSKGPIGSFGSQRSHTGYSNVRGPSSLHGVSADSQTTGPYDFSAARAMSRPAFEPPVRLAPPFPQVADESDTLAFGVPAPHTMPGMRMQMPRPSTPLDSMISMPPGSPMQPMAPMDDYGYGRAMTAEAPMQVTHGDLRAALPGSRMSEPPVRSGAPRERRTLLWVIIAVLLIVMIIAVIVLLRGLETPPTGALWPLLAV